MKNKKIKKNCTTCGLYIENKCCGTSEYYGKDTKNIFKNGCENYEISFATAQDNCENIEEIIEELTKQMI